MFIAFRSQPVWLEGSCWDPSLFFDDDGRVYFTYFELPDRILTGDLAVVLGAEGRGIRPSVLEQADHRIRIPMQGRVESLNVSTAGAVILYELLRRAEVAAGGASGAGGPSGRMDR